MLACAGVWLFACFGQHLFAGDPPAALSVGVFSCEVTPPVGHPLCGGWIKPLEAVDDPLLAKGIVLSDGCTRYVICSVDWCLLQTTAHDRFTQKIAAAAEVPVRQVSVHTVHQHNAPIADARAQELLDALPQAPKHLDLAFLDQVTDRVASAVRAACGRMQPVTQIGAGRARVEQFASNRRVRLADGEVHVRYSSTKDPVLQAAPEGLIDPWLRTVSLFDGDRPLVRLHYYATHPMSFYGDGRATSDTVGLARRQVELEEGVPQIYFTGCGGNLTGGKYNDGSPAARVALTGRIYAAMKAAIAATQRAPAGRLSWKTTAVEFAPRREPQWSAQTSRQTLANTKAALVARLSAALNLAWSERLEANPRVTISRLSLGPITLLHLPGEAFIEYQLYAQSLRPDAFVAVAAYGESGPGYICCDAALQEGGYEPTDSRVGPPSEVNLKRGIAELLPPVARVEPPFYPDKQHLLWWRDVRGRDHPVAHAADWAKRRDDILGAMQQVMGPLPPDARMPLDVSIEEAVSLPKYTRRKLTFTAETGDRVPAFLLIPHDRAARAPAMLCLHQTTPIGKGEPAGLGGNPNLHYAAELAERGYVTLAPDYPNFGEYRFDAYARGYASATMKGLANHRRAVDLLAALPEVDAHRLGVIGHSLGGHNALFLAAFERRLKAVVTSCGFNSFYKYRGGDLTGWSHAGYMPRIASSYGRDPNQMPFDFTEVLAAIAPRAVFVNAPQRDDNFELSGVKDCLLAAAPVYALFNASDRLTWAHPAGGHDFPGEIRAAAYAWLDRQLK